MGFSLIASVLCILAKMKVGVVLGWRLRDEAVSFLRVVESWAEVRAVKNGGFLGRMRFVSVVQIRLVAHGWLVLTPTNPFESVKPPRVQ